MPDRLSRREAKALVLSEYTLEKVLDLKFSKADKYRTGRLKHWIIDEVAPQLRDHVMSKEVKKLKDEGRILKAHIVIVIGSRHVLVWDMDCHGQLAEIPELVGRLPIRR